MKRPGGIGQMTSKASKGIIWTLRWVVFGIFLSSCLALGTSLWDLGLSTGFLHLDPIWHLIRLIGGAVPKGWYLGLAVILLTLILGRFFCHFLCPLGLSLDLFQRLLGIYKGPRSNKRRVEAGRSGLLYLELGSALLVFVLVSALFDLNLAHFLSPLSISNALFGLFLKPVVLLERGYQQAWIHLFFLLLPFFLESKSHRYWCIYICPTGWVLGFLSRFAIIKRMVDKGLCNGCGKCVISCPMAAIPNREFVRTDPSRCSLCEECKTICPEGAISFGSGHQRENKEGLWEERRLILLAGVASLGISSIATGKGYFMGEYKGSFVPPSMLRPPGAVPERAFELMCLRCGLCMAACPSNTLQPMGWENGILSLFTPIMRPPRGPCYPDCNICASVCPTGAIRDVGLLEKRWAKTGTAVIDRDRCIAWEWGKACLICDEACPYDAINMVRAEGRGVLVPTVVEERCNGCGACEFSCPVIPQRAVFVTQMGEIRLHTGSYIEEGRRQGLTLGIKAEGLSRSSPEELPPGFLK